MIRFRGIFRFFGYVLVGAWALLTVHLGYRYISFVSSDTNTKAGTFVEGINNNTTVSYLPYTSFSEANRFYQTFLFDSCLDYYFDGAGKLIYNEDLCTVTSDDEKTYIITINSGSTWSNGDEVTLDDVYFSYRFLLVDNVWERQSLRVFNDVSVSRNETSISVTFPESSPDNRVFFTHFILPSSLGQVSFDQYIEQFLRSPVWSGCATIYPQMGDDSNLVFDLSNCDDTHLLRYQLQLLSSGLEDTNGDVAIDGLSSDFYDLISRGSPDFDRFNTKDFTHMRVPLREYVMLFFNTQSEKLSAKIQRALGGYIFNNFYNDESYKGYLRRDHLGFDIFLSTGGSVEKYIVAKNPSISLDKYDLEKINIVELPQKLQLSADETEVYFLEEVRGYKTVEITLPSAASEIRVIHSDGQPYTPKTYESGQGRFFYSLSVYNENLDEGRNTYVIQTLDGDTWLDVASFEVYYLASPLAGENDTIEEADKIQVVYFVDEASLNVVSQLQKILQAGGLSDYFTWNGFESDAQFLGKISSLDYDMVVGTVNVGLREDLSALFSSKTPTINPSLYSQDNFVGLLSEFTTNPSVHDALLAIYSSDVPFIVMGQLFDSSFVRSPLISYLPVEVQGVYHFKRQLYENVSFGVQRGFQWNDVFNKQNIVDFFNHL